MTSSVKANLYISDISSSICAPFFDQNNQLNVMVQDSGDVLNISDPKNVRRATSTAGQPSGASCDTHGILYATDFGHGAVIVVHETGEQESIVATYEDKPLKGPSSIVCSKNGTIFFTDSGPFGETGLHNATGSLFMISSGGGTQILRPITLDTLAYPSAVAISPDGRFVYVAEMMKNRVLRYFQKPDGVFHGSVFYQLQGRVGPSSLVCDSQGCLYIGHYDIVGTYQLHDKCWCG